MGFSEAIKLEVKRKAHFSCCLCKAVGVEIHHIVPQESGGPDTIDNAAPLCPSCHEIYGANPTKRKFIREARDFWYELCADRFKPDSDALFEMRHMIENVVSKDDLLSFQQEVMAHLEGRPDSGSGVVSSESMLTVPRALSVILSKKYTPEKPLIDLLFHDILWQDDDLPELKSNFFRRFGEVAAEQVCREAMDELGLDLSDSFTEPELTSVLNTLIHSVALFCLLDEGKVSVKRNSDDELLWFANENA